jgi:N6-adenosine-specific RNA methylase IME4
MYNVILADPPWRQSKGGKKSVRPKSSGEAFEYPVLSFGDIQRYLYKASEMADENHALFLWAIDKYLPESEAMMKLLGYKLHARLIWNKVTGIPAAFTVRFGHEYLLWYYKDKLPLIDSAERGKIHTVFTEQVKRHSQKPDISYQIIERLYPNAKRLELFARRERAGWDVWGNEVESNICLN